jgi:hypothetical protein
MGLIETTRTASLTVIGEGSAVYAWTPQLLRSAGLKKVAFTGRSGEVVARMRSFTVWGRLTVLVQELPHAVGCPVTSRLDLTATANANNIYTLAENPAEKIIRLIQEAAAR